MFQIIQVQPERAFQLNKSAFRNLKGIIPEQPDKPKVSLIKSWVESRLQTVMGVALMHRKDVDQIQKSLYSF